MRSEGLTFLIIIIIVVIWIKFSNAKPLDSLKHMFASNSDTPPDVAYQVGTSEVPKSYNPNILADRLYRAMKGVAVFPAAQNERANALNELYYLPNDEMVRSVFNTFNKKYQRDGKGNLIQWIRDEWHWDIGNGIDNIINRLTKAVGTTGKLKVKK